ncbi:acyl transferase/acyl hydrolase/lysophospholipase [Aspergillus similis]
MPTSSDVHLYHDPATINTDRPILFADSEGLSGGNRNPVGILIEHARSFVHKYTKKLNLGSQERTKVTRSYCVEHIYPRILYAFSDILCYVVQQDPRVMETLITKMIIWADNARHASLNQVTLPRVILVLNKISMDEQERKLWEDPGSATAKVIEGLKNCYELDNNLQAIADRWNAILTDSEKIYSVMDLFLRYFKSIFMVYVPPHESNQASSKFYDQVWQLRKQILSFSEEVRLDRLQSFSQMNSSLLESMFNKGFEHFFTDFDKPFDFFKFAMDSRPLPTTIVENAAYLLARMRDTDPNFTELDRRCVRLFASYRMMKIYAEPRPSFILTAENKIFTDPFRTAYRDFYSSSRCWFQINGRQCQIMRKSHTQGHMDVGGELIASGEYYTPFKEESCDMFIQALVEESKPLISLLNGSRTVLGPDSAVVKSHLAALKREREFWKNTFSYKTCFSCLSEPPDFTLSCGHTICRSCVKIFGRQVKQESAYDLDSCPLCSEGTQVTDPLAHVQLKPEDAGIRVLSIDGGGVRGVVSARILQLLEERIGLGGIISLALGANLWSAEKCVHEFKNLAKGSFKKRVITSMPIVGYIVSFLTDSYYDGSAIESALQATFSAPDGRSRFLLDEPYTSCYSVNVIKNETTLMTNYNRKTSNDDDRGPLIYRQDSRDTELKLWEACTSAAPFMFPVYRARNGHAYQDGGLNENNPIGIAVKEARFLWPGDSRVDVALSVGTGWADERIAQYNALHSQAVHGWLKRCIDSFESKLDSERLWQEYRRTLDEDERARHHRLNAKLPNTLPFMGDTGAIERMDHATKAFFKDGDGHQQLQAAAEALLASLFYVSVDCLTMLSDGERHLFKGRILCRLEQKHQPILLERLRQSNCSFRVHEGTVPIDIEDQESRFTQQESFQQVIHWHGCLRDALHIFLVFSGDVSGEVSKSVQYEISGSPFRRSLV